MVPPTIPPPEIGSFFFNLEIFTCPPLDKEAGPLGFFVLFTEAALEE